MSGKDSKFQVKLSGDWKDYDNTEDKILKRAYLAGFPNAKYKLRGQSYEVSFAKNSQKNLKSGKEREMRPPYKWSAPSAPIVPKGETMCVKVPPGGPGTTIQVPHPKAKGIFIAVNVPPTAKVGQAMLVPIPKADEKPLPMPAEPPIEPSAPPAEEEPAKKSGGWSAGAKVAAGGAAVVGIGGVAVAGAVMGEHLVDGDFGGAVDALADFGTDIGGAISGAAGDVAEAAPGVGEAIAAGAEDAVDWAGDTADAAGDLIMDLF